MIAKAKSGKSAKSDGVVIENIGPIEHLELEAKPGTITVLRGYNGRGKTTALEAIDALTRGGGKLESRDGTVGGTASGFGVQIKVGRGGANRRTGDLVVTAVEDNLSIADFVEPNIKDPVSADSKRLKALVALAGLNATPQFFESLCDTPDEFRSIVKPDSLATSDPVEMAAKVKRDFEAASRLANTKAERLFGEIKAKLAANDGIDLEAPHDREALQKALEATIAERTRLYSNAETAQKIAARRKQAQEQLETAAKSYDGPGVAEAKIAVEDANDEFTSAAQVVARIEAELRSAKESARDSEAGLKLAKERLSRAEQHEQTIAGWKKTIDETETTVPNPSTDDLTKADQSVQSARRANEDGVLIRAALMRKEEAEQLEEQRAEAVKLSESLRETAAKTLDVLAEGVKELVPGLTLDEELRIRVPHPKRGECYYSDLSHGERWRLAIDLAVSAFERKGQRGVLALPQESWEGLDGANRQLIAEHIAKTDLIVFTAEAERGTEVSDDLAVEVL